jgi:Mrp family chromosome partitioning ATPase
MHIRLRAGRAEEAVSVAEQSLALISFLGGAGAAEVELRLAAAIALDAAGRREGAEAALREACRQIEIREGSLRDPDARARFRAGVPENAEALALARAWFGDRAKGASATLPPEDLP